MKTYRILVVDDEAKMRRLLELSLADMGYAVEQAGHGREALALGEHTAFDLILTDLRMPELDGLGLLRALRERGDETPVIVMTAYGTIETAVEAMKLGAVDYIIRPFEIDILEVAVKRALTNDMARRENRYLRDEVDRGWGEFVGTGPAMQSLYRLIERAAPAASNIFIVGATGTGKELVAHAVHRASGREGLFVPVNCAAIPTDLLESELFGHQKGAFTGAMRERIGKVEMAHGGTLFLDEITEMPLALQAKLLRMVQEGTVERLGAQRARKVDVRIVAATNRDPLQAVHERHLREDLYFRLNVVRIDVPALRDRGEDIPLLAQHFLHKYASELGRPVPALGTGALERLRAYDWPGNVRELENLMERAAVLCQGDSVPLELLPINSHSSGEVVAGDARTGLAESEPLALRTHVETLEKTLIEAALGRTGNNKAAAARLLEISERALWYKIKRYGL